MRTITMDEFIQKRQHISRSTLDSNTFLLLSYNPQVGTVAERVRVVGPRPGDLVRVTTDAYYAANTGDMAMITNCYGDPADGAPYGVILHHHTYRPLDGSYVSASGGPTPSVTSGHLTFTGQFGTASYWYFAKHRVGAGLGIDYKVDNVPVWLWDGIDKYTANKGLT